MQTFLAGFHKCFNFFWSKYCVACQKSHMHAGMYLGAVLSDMHL